VSEAPDDDEQLPESALSATLHREYWGPDHGRCVVLCLNPPRRPRRRAYCPGCGKRLVVRPRGPVDDDPEPGRLAVLWGAFREGSKQGRQDAERLWARLERRPAEASVTVQVGVICKGGTFV
jgi:hypothetical protein